VERARRANWENGTGGACAPLSEVRSSRRWRSRRQDDRGWREGVRDPFLPSL